MPTARPQRKAAPTVGVPARRLLRELMKKFGPGLPFLQEHWSEIVGARLSQVTQPSHLTRGPSGIGGTLRVKAPTGAATLIQADAQRIIERIRELAGRPVVARLIVEQGHVTGPHAPANAHTAPRGPQPRPIGAEDEDHLQGVLKRVQDDRQRAILERIGRAVISRSRN